MKRKIYFIIAVCLSVLLLGSCLIASAEQSWFVNGGGTIPQFFEGVYAIGAGGTVMLDANEVYALTADGLAPLGTANISGGGGLRYDDGLVSIRSDLVRVGLYYYYSPARDSSLVAATLKSVEGDGFSIGCYDAEGSFTELASTDVREIVLRREGETGICVFSAADGELLASVAESGKNSYLSILPICDSDEAVTRLGDNQYFGSFDFAILGGEKLTVVNVLDLEHYVMGVCAIEMSEGWPLEALKAQAVCGRTYAQRMIGNSTYYYSCGFDLTADTYSQAYLGCAKVGDRIRQAVNETANEYLTYRETTLANAVYSAADGGATESSTNVFGGGQNPYLLGIMDPYESYASEENPYSAWTVTVTPTQLGEKVGIGPVSDVQVTKSATGNVIKLELFSASGQKATVIRDNCRTVMGVKSIRYSVVQTRDGNFVFSGSGCGHNVGMSQWGAYAMAKYFDKNYQDILGFYYTEVGLSFGELE